jgi:hypothetical protein
MILPTAVNTTAPQPSGLAPDDMWAALIQHSFPTNAAYQKSDQVFIDEWKQAIDAAESIFTDVTLFLGRIFAALPVGAFDRSASRPGMAGCGEDSPPHKGSPTKWSSGMLWTGRRPLLAPVGDCVQDLQEARMAAYVGQVRIAAQPVFALVAPADGPV